MGMPIYPPCLANTLVGSEMGAGSTLPLINAGLAQSKGRSGLVRCLISLPLGPIATFLIVVLGKVPSAME